MSVVSFRASGCQGFGTIVEHVEWHICRVNLDLSFWFVSASDRGVYEEKGPLYNPSNSRIPFR